MKVLKSKRKTCRERRRRLGLIDDRRRHQDVGRAREILCRARNRGCRHVGKGDKACSGERARDRQAGAHVHSAVELRSTGGAGNSHASGSAIDRRCRSQKQTIWVVVAIRGLALPVN
jgi:hypothetical protein